MIVVEVQRTTGLLFTLGGHVRQFPPYFVGKLTKRLCA
jgi:hypothetical protein